MRPELLKKAIARLDDMFFHAASPLAAGNTDFSEKRKKSLQKRWWRKSPQFIKWEKMVRNAPDHAFEGLMSELDSMPAQIHKAFKDAAANTPKDRGGRPSAFPLDIRRRAIQDVRSERAQCDILSDAIDIVAKRYGMTPNYLRKVWKNRKRLDRN